MLVKLTRLFESLSLKPSLIVNSKVCIQIALLLDVDSIIYYSLFQQFIID